MAEFQRMADAATGEEKAVIQTSIDTFHMLVAQAKEIQVRLNQLAASSRFTRGREKVRSNEEDGRSRKRARGSRGRRVGRCGKEDPGAFDPQEFPERALWNSRCRGAY
jgi:hypothetical protein